MALSAPEALTAAHDVSEFSCGKPTLDHWLKTRALSNQEKGITAVMVVHDDGRVVGYCGLAPTAVVPSVLPRSVRTGQPPDPVPCLLLGQLAADTAWADQGIGTGLLKHALQRCVQAAALVGGRALMVNAVDAEAAQFWRRRGFLPSKDDPLVLLRPIFVIAASLDA
ncbi:GNAT family N-acetyltransferase [Roseospira marina]|uniref:GNAT family N-acetyltransferase n=1 Tax=Roseospira marina TaxID=140057 RepID=A0A5M6IDM8_9PROT|nr:GNAT family N-acetyltransferase [Roseospira marina]KAA5606366.1 GNAT family N-acetyltransferase [Roseospira marina]MBB4314233.1 GNAT superfamily N-acetyltransferase [Roseospira marina]MBB5087393.1 GNAT superfamily N-acetyltransferase [Roseospira marina]